MTISTEQNNSFSTNFWSYEGSRPTGDKKRCNQKKNQKEAAHWTCEARAGKNTNRGICKVPGKILGSEDQVLQIWGKFPVFKDCKKFRKAVSRRYGTDLVLPQTLTEAVNLKLWWQAWRAQLSPAEMLKQRMQWRWWKQNWTPSHEISDEYTEEVTRKCYEFVGTGKFLPKDRKIKNHLGDKKTATR